MADKTIEVTEGSDNVFRDLGFPEEEAAALLAQASADVAHQRAAEAPIPDEAVAWGPPEIEQDEGDVTVRAFTLDLTRAKSITVKRNSVLVVDTTMDKSVKVSPVQRFSHHAFRPPGQRFGADQVDPTIKAMARAIALAEGHDADEHWFDADRWGKDVGGPCWLFYTDHAKLALEAYLAAKETP